jgi:hypothetical protein
MPEKITKEEAIQRRKARERIKNKKRNALQRMCYKWLRDNLPYTWDKLKIENHIK